MAVLESLHAPDRSRNTERVYVEGDDPVEHHGRPPGTSVLGNAAAAGTAVVTAGLHVVPCPCERCTGHCGDRVISMAMGMP